MNNFFEMTLMGANILAEYTPQPPPGVDKIQVVVSWVLWAAALILFIHFIIGIVKAGRAHQRGDEVVAPLWPLGAAALLGAAGLIWNEITGL